MPRLRSRVSRLLFLAVFLLVSSASALAGATDYTYAPPLSGLTTRHWSDVTQWSPLGVPGPGDTATVDLITYTYGLEVDEPGGVTVLGLTLNGSLATSELVGNGVTIQAGGYFDWKGGGTQANITLLPGATGTFELGTHWLDGVTFTNGGAINWTGGLLLGDQSAVFQNNGALTVTVGTTGFASQVNSCDFYNAGTLNVTGSGTVNGGGPSSPVWGFHNTGIVSLGAGTTLEWQNALNEQHSLDAGGQITGTGTLLFDEPDITQDYAVLTLNGTTTVAAGATLSFSTGVQVNAGDAGATIQGPGKLLWTGGQLIASSPSGTDNMQPSLTWASNLVVHLTGGAVKDLAGAYVISAAPVTWDAGPLGMDGHTYFTNNGMFTAAGDLATNPTTPGVASTFENHGTLVKSSGSGTLTVNSVTVLNYGTIDAASGTISLFSTSGTADVLEAGSTLKGSIVSTCEVSLAGTSMVAAGATFELGNDGMGDQAILDGSGTLGGPGTIRDRRRFHRRQRGRRHHLRVGRPGCARCQRRDDEVHRRRPAVGAHVRRDDVVDRRRSRDLGRDHRQQRRVDYHGGRDAHDQRG